MKANEKGFSVVEILIVIVVVGLLGVVGWRVWYAQHKASESQQSTVNTGQIAEKTTDIKSDSPRAGDTLQRGEIKKIAEIQLKVASDVDKLPSYTPESFKSYMRQNLANQDTHGCGNEASVSIISLTALAGGAGSSAYNSADGTCQGDGAGVVWYLDASEKWNSVYAGDACTGENDGGKVPSAFMKNAMHDTCSAFTDTKY